MTWIKTTPPREATGALKAAYQSLAKQFPAEYGPDVEALRKSDGTTDSIVESHSPLPSVMQPMFTALAELMSPALPLSRTQHEMINTLVSSLNSCHY